MNKIKNSGFTLIELIIAVVITIIIIWEIYNCFILSMKNLSVQKDITDMIHNARASIEFITSELKNISSITNIDSTKNDSNITISSFEETGIVTSSTLNTITDSTKLWMKNEWKDDLVLLIDANGNSQTKTIISNNAIKLNVSSNWSKIPDNESLYQIISTKSFSRNVIDNKLEYSNGGLTSPFASNITGLTIMGYNSEGFYDSNVSNIRKLEIALTAKTPKPDTRLNNQYHYYTVKTSFRL